jgi:hypothetical protein
MDVVKVIGQTVRNDLPNYNRRRQALDWLRTPGQSYRLVQESFLALGYSTLEQACEQADGFSLTREPKPPELSRIKLLERLAALLLPELLSQLELPPCKIIKMEITLNNSRLIARWQDQWEQLGKPH